MSPVETEWLSNHMGHTLNIHKNFYRLQDSVIEMAKVSRLLMAVDKGELSKYQGKGLQDINVNGNKHILLLWNTLLLSLQIGYSQ
jgi:hypothetical protein